MSYVRTDLIARLMHDEEFRQSYVKFYAWVLKRKPPRRVFMRVSSKIAVEMEILWENEVRKLSEWRLKQKRSKNAEKTKSESKDLELFFMKI